MEQLLNKYVLNETVEGPANQCKKQAYLNRTRKVRRCEIKLKIENNDLLRQANEHTVLNCSKRLYDGNIRKIG